ncbi:MAG: DUF1156 domain-containing protein [Immundisolibacterales bacterium]|nr:DUF1156 domain-containing protein [Immundisolibacterales bacterium]
MSDRSGSRRLIESGFPLKEASIDSVHEKNVRHGHISTLHVWPARRPLAASRAVLLATLLDDPGSDGRRELLRRIGGSVVKKATNPGEKEETSGGVLRWGREASPDLARLRDEIREAFGGRSPKVLDPFAGGGAIPLEAMRLGCEVTASDINPVAWFILRCTLHYPRLTAGQTRPLPDFALRDRGFVEAFLKARGIKRKSAVRAHLARLGHGDGAPEQQTSFDVDPPEAGADFPWHLRAWGRRVLAGGRRELASRYPTYAEFEPVKRKGRRGKPSLPPKRFRRRPSMLLEPDAGGQVSVEVLNAELDSLYLEDPRNPRWVAKPTVAYLWARTAECGDCRAEIPLLKTRWLCRRRDKRVLLEMTPREDRSGVEFDLEQDVPTGGDDNELGAGTMSQSGAECPCCGAIATMQDLRAQGRAGRLGARMTGVVADGQEGKEYRLAREEEIEAAEVSQEELEAFYAEIPFGLPGEPTPSEQALGMRMPRYGFNTWDTLFSSRQLLALGAIVRNIRSVQKEMETCGYPDDWREALVGCLAPSISRLADRCSALVTWTNNRDQLRNTFARFALPMVWDFAESCPLTDTTGGFVQAVEWIARVSEHAQEATVSAPPATLMRQSAIDLHLDEFDLICTDPPYYDAIPYSDLMDFFHVWLRRVLHGLTTETDAAFASPLGPKWDADENDGELIDDASRFGGDRSASKQSYEDGMARAFGGFHAALRDDGRLVVVFANKNPDAWETLVSALIRAGFVVTGSWPVQTERHNRQRSLSSAALASSIWIVCRKRPASARAGWDRRVLDEMRKNITDQLRDFWDAGIRGPDFVWAATGPALEAYSRHPVVKITDAPGRQLAVAEFLRQVRRMVVGFVVSRLLNPDGAPADELDDVTSYYLLHRNDFGLKPAAGGASILYALSCNLSDSDLAARLDILARGGKRRSVQDDDDGEETAATGGGEVRLKAWDRRRGQSLGQASSDGTPPSLIDCLHKLMQLWKAGDRRRVDGYLEERGLWRHELFSRLTQAVLELAEGGSEERAILESIQNHLRVPDVGPSRQRTFHLDVHSTK